MSEPEEQRWEFCWKSVGYGANRDEALLNAIQWLDQNSPCDEIRLDQNENNGGDEE